jgi:cell division protein FtsB
MAITDDARDHLFETLRRQYDEDDARTLITMLSSHDPDSVATRAQLDTAVERLDASIAAVDHKLDTAVERLDARMDRLETDVADLRQEMRQGFADARVEMKDAFAEQTRTFTTWMFALLTVYTVVAGSFVALGTFIVAS